ncbi:MAG: helix-turn-helix domain-containing protein [Hellea sp.]|nr:helix-turn-helix domain-containing protein [Hellea sp.]
MPHGETPYPKSKDAQRRLFDRIIRAGRDGKSHSQIAEMIGIGRDTLQNWIVEQPDLSRVMTLADDYALAWWESLGQRQAETKEGNSSVFMFIMKNRFDMDYGKDTGFALSPDSGDHELAALSPETRNALRALLRDAAARDHRTEPDQGPADPGPAGL